MRTRISLRNLFVALLALANPPTANAAETWDCHFKVYQGPPGALAQALVEIDGDSLDWKIQAPVTDRTGRPVPKPDGGYQSRTIKFRYRVLENNKVGIVAAGSQAPKLDAQVGPIILSDVILINKSDGHLRLGDIGIGSYDVEDGRCHKT